MQMVNSCRKSFMLAPTLPEGGKAGCPDEICAIIGSNVWVICSRNSAEQSRSGIGGRTADR